MVFAHSCKLPCLTEVTEKSFRAKRFGGQTCTLVLRHRESRFLSVPFYRVFLGELQTKVFELEMWMMTVCRQNCGRDGVSDTQDSVDTHQVITTTVLFKESSCCSPG